MGKNGKRRRRAAARKINLESEGESREGQDWSEALSRERSEASHGNMGKRRTEGASISIRARSIEKTYEVVIELRKEIHTIEEPW